MKKIITIIIIISLVLIGCIRFYFVNKDVDKSDVQVYKKGVTVPVEKDFFENSNEDMDGYTFRILDAYIMKPREYFEKYNAEDQLVEMDWYTDYLYVVKVVIGNEGKHSSEQKGIALTKCTLKGTTYILSFNEMAFGVANPNVPSSSFSLNPNTEKEFIIPFTVIKEYTSYTSLQKDPPKLQISLFPNEKLLELY